MQKKAILALLLAVVMMVTCSCALIEKDEAVDRATEIIKVGSHTHTKGEIKDQVDYQLSYMAYMYSMYGLPYDPTDAANIADAQEYVINALIEQDVQEDKIAQLGITLTEEEEADAVADADAERDYYRSVYQENYFADSELEGDALTAAVDEMMAAEGYDYDSTVKNNRVNKLMGKLKEQTVADITVTDEELQAELDTRAESARTNYETNLSSYGSSFNNGSTVYYRPAGYRLVKQILVKFTAEDQAQIDTLNSKLTAARSTADSLRTQLTDTGLVDIDGELAKVTVTTVKPEGVIVPAEVAEGTTYTAEDAAFSENVTPDQADLLKQLAVANAEVETLTALSDEMNTIAFANIDAAADDIIAQLDAGADWDALMAEKTEDPGMQTGRATAETGYAVCENMTGMDVPFVTASMALANVGDVSPKTAGMYGYYIIKYVGDVAEGPVALDDVRESLSSTVLTTKQNTYFDEQVASWVEAAKATIDLKALNN